MPGYGQNINSLKPSSLQRLTRSFYENETQDMPDATNFILIANLSPFLGGLLDSVCSITKTAKTALAFTKNVAMLNILSKRHKSL